MSLADRENAVCSCAILMLVWLCTVGCDGRSETRVVSDATTTPTKTVASTADNSAAQDPHVIADLFKNVTVDRGIDFVHRPADHEQRYFMPNSVGSGVAIFDYDGDDRMDIYFIQNSGPDSERTNRLYRQQEDGHFHDVTAGSGLAIAGYGMGAAAGDVNNDGRMDLLLSEYGRARLLLNQSTGPVPKFIDVTEEAGVVNPMWGTSTCFVDYDRDGWLDLVLVNYITYDPSRWCADGSGRQEFCGPDAFSGRVTKLFHNASDGRSVRFDDVTATSGLASQPGPGLGVYCADFTGDRWPDIFVANDGRPNHLWVNQRDGTFQEQAITRGIGYNNMGRSEADMGIAIGDVDGNGLFDIFVTHLSDETHTLWSQEPQGVFVDRTAMTGLTSAGWRGTGFGTVMVDVENDGDQDLILANGRVTRSTGPAEAVPEELDPFWHPYAQRDQIFINRGEGDFVDASLANDDLCGMAHVSRGLACADFNNDGAVDILVTHIGGPPALLYNQKADGHWLMIRARLPQQNRDAYGAEVHVLAGDQRWVRIVNPGFSYLCSNDPRLHVGLGQRTQIDAIQVRWPDGMVERFPGGTVDREVVVERGAGQPVPDSKRDEAS